MLPDAPLVLFSRATGPPFREIANAPLVLLDWKCRQAGVGLGCAEPQAAPMPASSCPMHRWCPESAGLSLTRHWRIIADYASAANNAAKYLRGFEGDELHATTNQFVSALKKIMEVKQTVNCSQSSYL